MRIYILTFTIGSVIYDLTNPVPMDTSDLITPKVIKLLQKSGEK